MNPLVLLSCSSLLGKCDLVTTVTFRADFPEFGDAGIYSDASVTFWLNISVALVQQDRWLDLTDMGVELATAHQLVVASPNQTTAAKGGTPGQLPGLTVSKAVDRVSVSKDYSGTTLDDAGFWNMSTYGIQFLRLARMFGAGPVQL